MIKPMTSVELGGVIFNTSDLCIITQWGNDELNLFNSNRMRIDKIYSNHLGDIKMHLFDDRFKRPYGTVIVYTSVPEPHKVITKLKRLNIHHETNERIQRNAIPSH